MKRRFLQFFATESTGGAASTAEPPIKSSFTEAFEKALKTDPDAPLEKQVKPAEVKKEVEKPKSEVPDALFKGKAEEKKDETNPFESEVEKIVPPEFKHPDKKQGWDALRTKALALEKAQSESVAKIAETEKKLAEAEARGANTDALTKKLAELEAKNAEMDELVSQANVEMHPEFRAKFIEGRASLVSEAKKLIDDSGGDSSEVEAALALKGKARTDAIRDAADALPGFAQGQLGDLIRQIDRLDTEAGEKRAKSADYWQELQKGEQERTQKEREEFTTKAGKAFESAQNRLARELEVLMPAEGHDDWNQTGERIRKEARAHFEGNTDMEAAAEASIRAQAMPIYRELYIGAREEVTSLKVKLEKAEADLATAYGSSPKINGGKNGDTPVKKMGFMDRFNKEWQGEV